MCGSSVRRSAAVSSVVVVMYTTICLWITTTVFTASQAAAMVTGTPAVGDFRDSTTMTPYGDEEEIDSELPSMGMAPAAAAAATASVSDGGFSNSGWTTESAGVTSMTTTFEDYSAGGYFPRDRMGPPSMNSHYLTPSAYHKDKLKSTEENIILRAPSISSLSSTSSVSVTETSLTHSMGAIAKPTKYHYYPHNQHMYLLPECAVQQVCSAVYVRLNYTQPLCACPSRYREPCSASLNSDDLHTTELSVDSKGKVRKILTLVKTCEPVKDMRLCRAPRDWSLLALQNVRTGKSHYLVICHCPDSSILEGPTSHDQPTYASVPGIKVYGMVCISKSDDTNDSQLKRKVRLLNSIQGENETNNANDATKKLKFPYEQFQILLKYVNS